MDIDFLQIDLNPCIIGQGNEAPNYFAGTAKCKPTTMVRTFIKSMKQFIPHIIITRQVTRATHVRNRICPRVKLIIIIILLIIFLGFIKSKPLLIANNKSENKKCSLRGF